MSIFHVQLIVCGLQYIGSVTYGEQTLFHTVYKVNYTAASAWVPSSLCVMCLQLSLSEMDKKKKEEVNVLLSGSAIKREYHKQPGSSHSFKSHTTQLFNDVWNCRKTSLMYKNKGGKVPKNINKRKTASDRHGFTLNNAFKKPACSLICLINLVKYMESKACRYFINSI